MNRQISNSIALIVIFAGVAVLLQQMLTVTGAIQMFFGLLLVLILPGYVIVEAFFPKAVLGLPERLLLSLGSSLALAALGSIFLNRTGLGLERNSWLVLFGGVVLVGGGAVWWRNQQHRQNPAQPVETAVPPVRMGLKLPEAILIGLALLVTVVAVSIGQTPAPSADYQGYTMLWMLPGSQQEQQTLHLGVKNVEFGDMQYRLVVHAGDKVIEEWPTLHLASNEQWENSIQLTPEQWTAGQVEAMLYRSDAPEAVYRHVVLK